MTAPARQTRAPDASHHAGEDTGADWASTFPRHEWFDVRELEEKVWLIAEPGHVNSFLVEGDDLAVLLDTGLGIADICSVARSLSGKPLRVVNTHHHFDHTNGNLLFEDVAIHRSGEGLLAAEPPEGLAAEYLAYVERVFDAWREYKDLDDVYFHLLSRETLLRPFPEGFDRGTYAFRRSSPTRLLDDGDEIDLGGRVLRVLHTPGHSPDSICLLDEHRGLLFGGDTINTGPIYAQLEGSDVGDFARSTARLAGLASSVRRVFVCHFLVAEGTPRLLSEIAEGFERIVGGDVRYRDNVDCFDVPVREARFDHFSVFLPAHAVGLSE